MMNGTALNKSAVFSLLAVFAAVLLGTAGCVLPRVNAPVGPSEEDQRFAMERVNAAAEALRTRGDTTAAMNAVKEAFQLYGGGEADLYGNGSSAASLIGRQLIDRGQPVFAARYLSDAVKDEKMAQDPLLWSTLAQAYLVSGDSKNGLSAEQEAERRADAILAQIGKFQPTTGQPPSPELQRMVQGFFHAGTYFSDIRQEPEKSFKVLREALRLLPDNPLTLNQLGYTLADRGTTPEHFREALTHTRRAAEQMPRNGAVVDSYGWALYKTGDLKASRRILQQAVSLDPYVPELQYHLGVVLAALGETHAARIAFQRALMIQPNYADAREALTKLPPATKEESEPNIPKSSPDVPARTDTNTTRIDSPPKNNAP